MVDIIRCFILLPALISTSLTSDIVVRLLVVVDGEVSAGHTRLITSADQHGIVTQVFQFEGDEVRGLGSLYHKIVSQPWKDDDVIIITTSDNYLIDSVTAALAAQVALHCLLNEVLLIASSPTDRRSPNHMFNYLNPDKYVTSPLDRHVNNTLDELTTHRPRPSRPIQARDESGVGEIDQLIRQLRDHHIAREQYLRDHLYLHPGSEACAFAGLLKGLKVVLKKVTQIKKESKTSSSDYPKLGSLVDLWEASVSSALFREHLRIGIDNIGVIFHHSAKTEGALNQEGATGSGAAANPYKGAIMYIPPK